jgi:hypothetical protein
LETKISSYLTYFETKICRAIKPIWRGKSAELLDLFGEETL